MAAKRASPEKIDFSAKRRSTSAGKSTEVILPSHIDEIDFPRGGASTLSPLEVRRIKQEAEKDLLFGTTPVQEIKKKKKRSKSLPAERKDNNSDADLGKTSGNHVASLSFKKLCEGMKLLGAVKEVGEFELIISLPNGLSGFVHILDINEKLMSALAKSSTEERIEDSIPSLGDLFTVNSLVVCVVKELLGSKHGHRKVKLSLRPEDVNAGVTTIVPGFVLPGCVSSVEDHGYVLSFGIPGKTGFLSKKKTGRVLVEGQYLNTIVESADTGRVIRVSVDQDKIKSAMISSDMKVRFSSLLPGMLVNTRVSQCTSSGVIVSFLELFEGSVHILHLPENGGSGENLEKLYKKKSKHVARILYVNPKNKVVSLSMLDSIIQFKLPSFESCSIGDIFDNVTITRGDQGLGLLANVKDGLNGFVHFSQVSDKQIEKLGKKYKAGTSHKCRVLGMNTIDGLLSLTTKKSIINKPFMRYEDIKPGSIVEGTIITLEKFGMLVSVSDHIKGLVTNMHLADIILKHPEKKLTEGKVVKCRVLTVDPGQRRLHLTHKKTMVSSILQVITQYSDAKPGTTSHGFITSVREYGCLVTFYNNVKGLVPKDQLGIQESEDPRGVFYLGQVLTCHVISCNPDQQKLKLSLKANSANKSSTQVSLQTASLVDIDVVSCSKDGLDVLLQPNGCPALLPVYHLSDHPSHWEDLLSIYTPKGKPITIRNALYYGIGKNGTHIVSLKTSLKNAAESKTMVTNFSDIKPGIVLPGFVKLLMGYGVFVEFAPGILGLAPNSFIANHFVSDAASHFKIGQTLVAQVNEVDAERQRFLVSLKQSDLNPGSDWTSATAGALLEEILSERKHILDELASKTDVKNLLSLPVGSCIEGKVSKVKKNGISLTLPDGLKGFVFHQLAQGVSCLEGEVVQGCVLDLDVKKSVVELTLLPDVVKGRQNQKNKPKQMKPGQPVDFIVQLIKAEYMVVVLPCAAFKIGYAPAKMHLNDIRDVAKRFNVGQKYRGSILESSSHCIVVSECQNSSKENLKPGTVTSVEVRSIKPLQMNVQLGQIHGRVHVSNAADDLIQGESPFKPFQMGQKIQAKILGFRDTKTHNFLPLTHRNFTRAVAELSLKPSMVSKTSASEVVGAVYDEKKLEDFKIGDEVQAFVKSTSDNCIWMAINTLVSGRVELLHASNDVKVLRHLSSAFKPGNGHTCTVLDVDKDHEVLNLSLTVKPDSQLSRDQVVPGRVTRVMPTSGLFIQLPLHKSGLVALTDIADHFTENPTDGYKVKQIVRCCILSKKDNGHYDLSLRPSRTTEATTQEEKDKSRTDREIGSLAALDVGDIVRGYVSCATNIGVFVSLGRNIKARVQIKNLSHFYVKEWKPLFPVGKLVTGKVLSINPTNGQIELSLKGRDVGGPDPAPNPKQTEETGKKRKKATKVKTVDAGEAEPESDEDVEAIVKRLRADESDDEQGPHESEESEECNSSEPEDGDESTASQIKKIKRIQVSAGFNWSGDTEEDLGEANVDNSSDEKNDSENESIEQVSRKKTKRQKRAAKKAEEDFLYRTEQALLDTDHTPECAEDFDRLVLSSPNNSVTWLQYMAFHLHTTEIDKARAVAERALRTISFREEREKLNIWVALMNLENLYGTQESLIKVFERALQHNEPKKVFFHLITIYTQSEKTELAEKLFHTMTKRFSQSKTVWIEFGRFFMKTGKPDSARKLLQRGLKSLPTRKHVETIVQFALMEFKNGDPQRGQTVLESVLSNYPKRTDIWSVYIDMMSKQGHPDTVRQIFERVIHMNLSSRKMKFLFKKYLDFEREHGDEMSVEAVKTKAMEYVESKVALA
ncbi:protein RRP5 homolog isoform X2 [Nematostella vectensis]|uniref:protein RRP5 homolog isoform X2 n=1 Tax=Nematostella vectensis TaxID=45351 RepID=UPI0020773B02|nr:protein RRP5 homolog isoform X2 [Nematostella vectensis]